MLNTKIVALVLLLVDSAVIGGADTAVYINSASTTADVTTVLNYKSGQRPTETSKHIDPVSTGRNKGYWAIALREQRFTLWIVLLLLVSFLVSTDVIAATSLHGPSGSFAGLLDLVKDSAQRWDGKLKGYAGRLFWMLASIQFIWMFMPLAFKQADLSEIVGELMRFILVIGFSWALLQFAPEWVEAMVNSFRQAGTLTAGLGEAVIRSDDIFGTAIELANTTGDVETWNPLTTFMVVLAGVLVLLCFAFIAAFMGLTIVEPYVVTDASVLFMGSGIPQWTREYTMAIVHYAVSVGTKLSILTLIVGLTTDSARQWQAAYNYDDANMWTMIGLTFVYACLAGTIPELVAGMTSGVSAGGGSSIGGMATADAADAAAVAATIATAGAAAPTATDMTGAAGAGGAGAAGTAGARAMGMDSLAGAINSSFTDASPADGAASSAGSVALAGVGSSTGGSVTAKDVSSAGSWVGGSAANSAPSTAPAQSSNGVQQAAKQADKTTQGGDDDKSQAAPGSASQRGVSVSSGDGSMSSPAPPSSTDTVSDDADSADSGAGGKDVSGRQTAEGVTCGPSPTPAVAIPGMESVADLSLDASQPQPISDDGNGDMPSMVSSSNSKPENVTRPTDPVPPGSGGPKPGTKGED